MPGIFISYRRRQGGYAGRLADDLVRRYGKELIFRDIEAIAAGFDFVEAIEKAVDSCDALIVIITPDWADVVDDQGRRRLENPEDFARVEVESALKRDTWVIPLLVGGATMPDSEDLPDGLKSLARRQAHEIHDASWEFNVNQLIKTLSDRGIVPKHDPDDDDEPLPPGPEPVTRRVGKMAKVGGVAVLGILVLAGAISLITGLTNGGNGGAEPYGSDDFEDNSSLVDAPTGGEDVKSPESVKLQGAGDAGAVSREPRQPPPDPVATHRPAILATLERASQAEQLAFRELDPDYLEDVYEGEALDSLYSVMNTLEMNDLHAAPESYGRTINSVEVSPDGTAARVEMVETNGVEFHANMNDFCVGQIPVHESRQTVFLTRYREGWVIYKIDFRAPPPDIVPCGMP